MSVFDGDFLGFTLGDIHSSQLNITRVSSGDRYSDNLTPNFKDVIEQVPGSNGTYYWKTYDNQQTFIINFAFDNMHDEDIRRLKQVLNFKGVQPLIFDESLYKKYYVKCSSPPIIKYVAFQDQETTVYKGDGTINLIAYYPYALSTTEIIINGGTNLLIFNVGDIEAPIKIYYEKKNNLLNKEVTLSLSETQQLKINIKENFDANDNDKYICIDSRTHLIEGLDNDFKKTGKLYNQYIIAGDFFTLPIGKNEFTTNVACKKIQFNYLYY